MTSVINEFKQEENKVLTSLFQEKDNIFGNMMNLTKDLLSVGKSAINVQRNVSILHYYLNFFIGNQRKC